MALTFAVMRRVHRSEGEGGQGEISRGILVGGRPEVGARLRLIREGDGRMLTTTPVLRILACDDELYLQTENSVYRVVLREVHGQDDARAARAELFAARRRTIN